MKAFFFIALLLCTCKLYGQTQSKLNEQAATELKNADAELNRIYKLIIEHNSADAEFVRNTKNTQRIWIQLRDAQMKMKYPDRKDGYYGSVYPMCRYTYLTSLTNERIKTLKEWLDGEEEGDVCRGTIPLNH